jgi:hypothetical protein
MSKSESPLVADNPASNSDLLRRAMMSLFIAVDESVAREVGSIVNERVNYLQKKVEDLYGKVDHLEDVVSGCERCSVQAEKGM